MINAHLPFHPEKSSTIDALSFQTSFICFLKIFHLFCVFLIFTIFKCTKKPVLKRLLNHSPVGETTRSMGLPTEACQMVNGLTQKQKAVCAESPALIPVILQVGNPRSSSPRPTCPTSYTSISSFCQTRTINRLL